MKNPIITNKILNWYDINKRLLPEYEDWQLKYIPHGISSDRCNIVEPEDTLFKRFERWDPMELRCTRRL